MHVKIKIFVICLAYLHHSAWALTCEQGVDVSPISDHLKIEKNLNPDVPREFCWAQQTCSDYEKNITMPSDYVCPEGFVKPYQKKIDENISCPLTKEEAIAILEYTYNSFECLNSYLRQTKVKSKSLDYFVNKLKHTLDKLPDYEGFVVRGATLPSHIKDLHKKGSVVTYDAFTSATTKQKPWGNQTFLIFSKTGKPIMNLSMANSEYEVLFRPGTKFKVLDISGTNDYELYVMKEVSDSLDPIEDGKQDLLILEKIKNRKKDFGLPDEWICTPQEMKKKVEQDRLPRF